MRKSAEFFVCVCVCVGWSVISIEVRRRATLLNLDLVIFEKKSAEFCFKFCYTSIK